MYVVQDRKHERFQYAICPTLGHASHKIRQLLHWILRKIHIFWFVFCAVICFCVCFPTPSALRPSSCSRVCFMLRSLRIRFILYAYSLFSFLWLDKSFEKIIGDTRECALGSYSASSSSLHTRCDFRSRRQRTSHLTRSVRICKSQRSQCEHACTKYTQSPFLMCSPMSHMVLRLSFHGRALCLLSSSPAHTPATSPSGY
jgi:hypothetical protein